MTNPTKTGPRRGCRIPSWWKRVSMATKIFHDFGAIPTQVHYGTNCVAARELYRRQTHVFHTDSQAHLDDWATRPYKVEKPHPW